MPSDNNDGLVTSSDNSKSMLAGTSQGIDKLEEVAQDNPSNGNASLNNENSNHNNFPKVVSRKPSLVVLPAKSPEAQSRKDWKGRKEGLLSWQDDVKHHILKARLTNENSIRVGILVANKLKTTIDKLQPDQSYKIDWENNVKLALYGGFLDDTLNPDKNSEMNKLNTYNKGKRINTDFKMINIFNDALLNRNVANERAKVENTGKESNVAWNLKYNNATLEFLDIVI